MKRYRLRRLVTLIVLLLMVAVPFANGHFDAPSFMLTEPSTNDGRSTAALLAELPVKGRAPKTGYERAQFGNGWDSSLGCDTRNRVLARDLTVVRIDTECRVISGSLADPYTGKTIAFLRGATTSEAVQIDHVVALSNAWQTGAQGLPYERRVLFGNDPLNLLAVDGAANQQKADGDAATWLPPNRPFRCQYVDRQVRVKQKYALWVTPAERDAIRRVLARC